MREKFRDDWVVYGSWRWLMLCFGILGRAGAGQAGGCGRSHGAFGVNGSLLIDQSAGRGRRIDSTWWFF